MNFDWNSLGELIKAGLDLATGILKIIAGG